MTVLAIPLEQVKQNFKMFNLLDDNVKFLPGFFNETLKTAPISVLSILRVDGDMYESCYETLEALYSKVSLGGWIIIDDFNLVACRLAVMDFRAQNFIVDPIFRVDYDGAYWQKSNRNGKEA